MIGTVWDSINLALSVALLVVALAALHTSKNWTQHKQRNATVIHNAKRGKNSYTTPTIVNKHSGLETPPPPATYAVYPSCQETRLKLIMLMQETQTVNSNLHIEDATPVGVLPPSPNHTTQHSHRQADNQPNNT